MIPKAIVQGLLIALVVGGVIWAISRVFGAPWVAVVLAALFSLYIFTVQRLYKQLQIAGSRGWWEEVVRLAGKLRPWARPLSKLIAYDVEARQAKALAFLHSPDEGLALMSELEKHKWVSPGMHASRIGSLLEPFERDDEAEAAYRRSVALEPKNPVYHADLARFLALRREDPAAARVVLEQLPKMPSSADWALALTRGVIMALEGDLVTARDHLSAAHTAAGKIPLVTSGDLQTWIRGWQAWVHAELGERQLARTYAQEARSLLEANRERRLLARLSDLL